MSAVFERTAQTAGPFVRVGSARGRMKSAAERNKNEYQTEMMDTTADN
jgi:hypothetical protein